ncbi:MAG: hypothetical protein ACSLEL_04135 [Candidatus Malihini olakiniferum]
MLKHKKFTLSDPDHLVVDRCSVNSMLKTVSQEFQSSNPLIRAAHIGQPDPKTVRLLQRGIKTTANPKLFTLNPVAKLKYRLALDLYLSTESYSNIENPLLALLEAYNKIDLESQLPL